MKKDILNDTSPGEAEYLFDVFDSDFFIAKANKKKVRRAICNFFMIDDDRKLDKVFEEVLGLKVIKDEAGNIVGLTVGKLDRITEWEDLPQHLITKDVFREIARFVQEGSWIEFTDAADRLVHYKYCFISKKLVSYKGQLVYNREKSANEEVEDILDENKKVSYAAYVHRPTAGADDYGVTFPDFPGCVSAGIQGELLAMAAEALTLHIKGMQEDGDEIPEPSRLEGLVSIAGRYTMLVEVTV